MRKLIVGLTVVGLVAMSAPAMAQLADPLGLTASGAVIPFVGDGSIAPGSLSLLEISSPVGDNAGLHMRFFDTTCALKGQSFPLPLTTNDVEIKRVDNLGGDTPVEGLIVIGNAPNGLEFPLLTLENPIHLRMLWANAAQDYIRILEPIQAANFDELNQTGLQSWNPLRSGATFWAPQVLPGILNTTIYFICPTNSVIGKTNSAALSEKTGFPHLGPPASSADTPLRVLIFDDEEKPLRDVAIRCTCLTATPITTISNVYANLAEAPNGTFTKVIGEVVPIPAKPAVCDSTKTQCPADTANCPLDPNGAICPDGSPAGQLVVTKGVPAHNDSFSFTGYRAITILSQPAGLDAFNRLSNATSCDLFPNLVGCSRIR